MNIMNSKYTLDIIFIGNEGLLENLMRIYLTIFGQGIGNFKR